MHQPNNIISLIVILKKQPLSQFVPLNIVFEQSHLIVFHP